MKYLIVDGYLNGTGIRDKYPEGFPYIKPEELGLSSELISKIKIWLSKYWDQFYIGYPNTVLLESLEKEGLDITNLIRDELKDVKVEYYSDVRMRTL